MNKRKWQVRTLDVWGNEDEGFDVNQEFHVGYIEAEEDADQSTLWELLKDGGFAKGSFRGACFEDAGEDAYRIVEAKSGKPVFILEAME